MSSSMRDLLLVAAAAERGQWATGALYAVGSLAAGLAAVAAGIWTGRLVA